MAQTKQNNKQNNTKNNAITGSIPVSIEKIRKELQHMKKETIEDYIQFKHMAYKSLKLTEIKDLKQLSTNNMKVICAGIGLNIESSQYGDILGSFIYEDEIYEFRFHVHKPYQKYAQLSNKMTNVEHILIRYMRTPDMNEEIMYTCTDNESTPFSMAFWQGTPLSSLSGPNYDMRILMDKIIAYSRAENYCNMLRKTDRKRIKYMLTERK